MKKLIFLMGIFGMSLFHAQSNIPEAQKGVEYGAGVPENITYNVQSPDQVIKSLKKKNEICFSITYTPQAINSVKFFTKTLKSCIYDINQGK